MEGMNPFRVATRAMLASYFVVNGVKALKEPEAYVEETQQFTDTVVPIAKNQVPQLPESATTWAMIRGGLQVAGGLAFVSGKGRRLGACLLSASLVPSLLASSPLGTDTEDSSVRNDDFLKNLALLGGTLIAAGDLQGRPGVGYRVAKRRARVAKAAEAKAKEAAKARQHAQAKAAKTAKKVRKSVTS